MCGIAGVFSFANNTIINKNQLIAATQKLNKRGPDNQNHLYLNNDKVGLGHARLSIIDTSSVANQPMTDSSGRFTIVFNGEVFNFLELKNKLESEGQSFKTNSDTEVILEMYAKYGETAINSFNGFFAFAIYDNQKNELFIARDRMGIKPFYYSIDKNRFVFASEIKAIQQFDIKKEIDYTSLKFYFQFNYIPVPNTIFKSVKKLEPGSTLCINHKGEIESKKYYTITNTEKTNNLSYKDAQNDLKKILESSVQRRLISDVPLGTFLSGGIDSSIISTIASKYQKNLNTFSIGFKDNPYFDETKYANLVAKKIKSNHTVFSLTNNDLYQNLNEILDYTDEPFADSSAIPLFILSKQTRKKVTVALSGDGADEMFGGYNKHYAEFKARQKNLLNEAISFLNPIWKLAPKSRNSKILNVFRQLNRFSEGYKLNNKERYWRWCAFESENYPEKLLKSKTEIDYLEYNSIKDKYLQHFSDSNNLNDVLYADMQMVLVNDMLTKVDLMSMANSLEVRVPFLDYELVNFAFRLPSNYKVSKAGRKTLLKDAYRNELPSELYNRNKMGFEVPLLQWFQTDLKELILNDLLEDDFIINQNLFNIDTIKELKTQLFSKNPGEVHAKIWALIVFQTWWKKNMN
jgi:asparagine synthase (glutamine-hydrolysing)